MRYKTDMAVEFAPKPKRQTADSVVKKTFVRVDERLSKQLNRPVGEYTTLETKLIRGHDREQYPRLVGELSRALKYHGGEAKRVLAVCLGNPDLTADALGDRVFKKLRVTRHLDESRICSLSAVTPNVTGMTGIESYDIVKGVVERTSPDLVIAVDSLAAAAASRIGSAFQLTDVGITPGSGVSNHRATLDAKSLGCRVVSVGVPLVVYVSTILEDSGCEISDEDDMIVTPKDIDLMVDRCAYVIAEAINQVYGLSI